MECNKNASMKEVWTSTPREQKLIVLFILVLTFLLSSCGPDEYVEQPVCEDCKVLTYSCEWGSCDGMFEATRHWNAALRSEYLVRQQINGDIHVAIVDLILDVPAITILPCNSDTCEIYIGRNTLESDNVDQILAREIGHCFGILSSDDRGSIMYPYIQKDSIITIEDRLDAMSGDDQCNLLTR